MLELLKVGKVGTKKTNITIAMTESRASSMAHSINAKVVLNFKLFTDYQRKIISNSLTRTQFLK